MAIVIRYNSTVFYVLAFIRTTLNVSVSPFFSHPYQQINIMHIVALILVAYASVCAVPFPSASVSQDHFEVLRLRASTTINKDAVTGTTCVDTTGEA